MKKITLFAAIGCVMLAFGSVLPVVSSAIITSMRGNAPTEQIGLIMSAFGIVRALLDVIGYSSLIVFFIKLFNKQQ